MNFMFLLLAGFIGLLVLATDVQALEKSGNQTRASGPDIYRIELRNIGLLRMGTTGDPDSAAELHNITISLREPLRTRDRQFHTVVQKAPFLVNTSGGERAGTGYLSVNTGDYVRLGERRGTEADYNLWLHSAYRNKPEDGNYLRFTVEVMAKELDCSGQRVCGRNNIGTVFYHIRIPAFRTAPPRDCQAQNTFTWTTVDQYAVLQTNSSLVDEIKMLVGITDDGSNPGFLSYSKGPVMQLMNAEVCVARTW